MNGYAYDKPIGYEIEKFKDSSVIENEMRERAMVTTGLKLNVKQYNCWTAEEIRFITENRSKMTAQEMSKKIKKTVKQIYSKIYLLKLNKTERGKKNTLKPIYGGTLPSYKPTIKVEKALSEYIVRMNEERQYSGNLDACKGYRDCLKDLDADADIQICQLTERIIEC